MGQWMETYRGAVAPWECDVVEHFTIAYYFDRFGDANLALMETVGMGRTYMEEEGRAAAAVHCHVRFHRELRAGDGLHIDSAILGVDGKAVRHGHKVVNSASGEAAATFQQTAIHFDLERRKSVPVPARERRALLEAAVEWDGPEPAEHADPEANEGFIDAARDTVKPWEIDILGHFSFQFYVHRFSGAATQAMTAFGMTPDYVREQRRAMSTFEIDIRFLGELHAGDLVAVKTGLVHLGNTSFRLLHRMFNARGGALSAVMSQFGVHLDMETRRPTPFPDELRRRAQALLVPGAPA